MSSFKRFTNAAVGVSKIAGKMALEKAAGQVTGRVDNFILYVKVLGAICFLSLTLVVGAILYAMFFPAHAADFSEGYRMGVVSKFSSKGFVAKSFEGQMLMGKSSAPYSVKGEKGTITINPWYFSSDKERSQPIMDKVGEYVWVKYREDYISTSVLKDTPYTITDIQPVTRKEPMAMCASDKGMVAKSDGVRVGRIVKVTSKGLAIKSNEVLFQMGDAGNQFKAMSISDAKVNQCAIDFLKSGKLVKVSYTESMFNTGLFDDTAYDIHKIEIAADL